MIRCILFAKSKQGTHCTTYIECPKLHLRALTLSIECHLFFSFKHNCIFHLNIVGTRQATIRNRITEKVWLEVTESLLATLGPLSKSVMNSSPKAGRKCPVKMKVIKPFSPVFYANKWLINRREKHPQIQFLDLRVFAVSIKVR